MYISVALNTFILCYHHNYPSLELLNLPKLKLCTHYTFLLPLPLVTTILHSISVDLTETNPEASQNWNHTVFALLRMAYFT